MEKEIIETGANLTHDMNLEDIVGSKEIPSVLQLSERTGIHFNTVMTNKDTFGEVIGVRLVKLQCLGEDITPYLPINELDCMIIGLLALSPVINQKLKEAQVQLDDKNVKNS